MPTSSTHLVDEPQRPQASTVHPLPSFTVVIPAYNEEDGIETTLDRLMESLLRDNLDFEVIVVNDGSTDGTAQMLAKRSDIRLVNHGQNRGYGASLKSGIRQAKHSLVVITDADATYPVDRIPELVRLAENADMVVGCRSYQSGQHSRLRLFAKWFLIRFAEWMARRSIPDLNSGLRVFKKPVVERFLNILPDGFSFTTTITLAMMTNNFVVHYEPVDYEKRVGRSKIKPMRDTLQFIQLILRTGMYFAPLRVFMPVAAIFFLGFVVKLGVDIYRGDLTEATLMLLVASAQLGMFALLADMLDKRTG